MTRRVTDAERAALPVAQAALEGRASAYGIVDSIVFGLSEAGMLRTPAAEPRVALSEHLRAAIGTALAHCEPATDEQVRAAVSDVLSVGGHHHQPLIAERLRRAESNVPAIVRRLLDTEARAEQMQSERDAFADRVDSLTAVAKTNRQHVLALQSSLAVSGATPVALKLGPGGVTGDGLCGATLADPDPYPVTCLRLIGHDDECKPALDEPVTKGGES